jgi:hypothetical protein
MIQIIYKNESTSRKYLKLLKDELDKKIAPIKLRLYQINKSFFEIPSIVEQIYKN